MATVTIHSQKHDCSAVFVRDALFVKRLAKLLIKMMVENNRQLNGLPETQEVLLKFIPLWAKVAVESEVVNYLTQSNEMQLEGFIRFRLNKQARDLRIAIRGIITCETSIY